MADRDYDGSSTGFSWRNKRLADEGRRRRSSLLAKLPGKEFTVAEAVAAWGFTSGVAYGQIAVTGEIQRCRLYTKVAA